MDACRIKLSPEARAAYLAIVLAGPKVVRQVQAEVPLSILTRQLPAQDDVDARAKR